MIYLVIYLLIYFVVHFRLSTAASYCGIKVQVPQQCSSTTARWSAQVKNGMILIVISVISNLVLQYLMLKFMSKKTLLTVMMLLYLIFSFRSVSLPSFSSFLPSFLLYFLPLLLPSFVPPFLPFFSLPFLLPFSLPFFLCSLLPFLYKSSTILRNELLEENKQKIKDKRTK